MALLTTTVVGAANVPATEVIVANTKAAVALQTGNVYRITLEGGLGSPQFGFNIHVGPTGSVSDNVIYSSNNIQSNTFLLTDLNNWANNNGLGAGASPGSYYGAAAAGIPTPAAVAGELLLVVASNNASNTNAVVSLISTKASGNPNELLSALGGPGVLFNGTVLLGTANTAFITVGAKAFSPNSASYVGPGLSANATYGSTPQGNAWNLVAGTAVSNGKFQLGVIEQLA